MMTIDNIYVYIFWFKKSEDKTVDSLIDKWSLRKRERLCEMRSRSSVTGHLSTSILDKSINENQVGGETEREIGGEMSDTFFMKLTISFYMFLAIRLKRQCVLINSVQLK